MEQIQDLLTQIRNIHDDASAIQLTEHSTPSDITQAQTDYYRCHMDMMYLLQALYVAAQSYSESIT